MFLFTFFSVALRNAANGLAEKVGPKTRKTLSGRALLALGIPLLCSSCLSMPNSEIGGVPIYENMSWSSHTRTFSIAPGSPAWALPVALLSARIWNERLGSNAIQIVASEADAVLITFDQPDRFPLGSNDEWTGWTNIEACQNTPELGTRYVFQRLYERLTGGCYIVMATPKVVVLKDDLHLIKPIAAKSPWDKEVAKISGSGPANFLLTKLATVTMMHEMGHSLGLGHVADESCLMNPTPGGTMKICEGERMAVLTNLDLAGRVAQAKKTSSRGRMP